MKIILHIGSNKTGSTAIQDNLFKNAAKLKKFGALYPRFTETRSHSVLLPALLEEDEYATDFGRGAPEVKAQGILRSEQAWDDLKAQIQSSGELSYLVLSSEYILGLRPITAERLIGRLNEFSNSIYVYAYLREPCSHYLSSTQQLVKYGARVKSPTIPLNYREKLDKFQTKDLAELSASVFHPDRLRSGNIVIDFLSKFLNEEQTAKILPARSRENASVSAEAMVLLQEFNSTVWGERRLVGNPVNKKLLAAIQKEERKREYTKAELKPRLREIVYRANYKDSKSLQSSYGINYSESYLETDPKNIELTDEDKQLIRNLQIRDVVSCSPEKLDRLRYFVYAHLARL